MNAPASNGGGALSGSATTSQVHGNSGREDDAPEQTTLEAYGRQIATTLRVVGERRSRQSDPDAFDAALRAIEEVAAEGWTFDAADVRARLGPGYEAVLGAAFGAARRASLIECAGYGTSRTLSRHGSLTRVWRRRLA